MISVLAPSILKVEAVSSTSVKVFIKKPEDTTGIKRYTASIEGDKSDESKSCVIKVEEEENLSYHSEASEGKSGWTKPLAPSILKVEAVSSTSVKVFIKKPEDITGIAKYTANIKGDRSKSCDISKQKVELSCEISNLSPGRQYTVIAYSWLSNKNIEYQSEASEEKSVWTKPSAPSIVNVYSVSSTSVKVLIRKPVDTTGIIRYTASIEGDRSKSCDISKQKVELSCEISNLSPGRQYTVMAYSWLSNKNIEYQSEASEEKSVWTKPSELSQQPSKGKVGARSVEVIWSKVAGVDGYQARAVESADGVSASSYSSTCETDAQASSCTIEGLNPSTKYSVSVRTYKIIPQNQRIVYNAESPKSLLFGDFSDPFFVVTETQALLMRKAVGMSALTVEQFEPPELSYLSQIPQPIPSAEFSGRLQALNDPTVSAGLFQSMQCVTTECRAEPQKFGAPESTDERFADPCELLMSGLLK
ncbi:hypothetical protein Aperf_G00000121643 [Anoplocephala perfoliata]